MKRWVTYLVVILYFLPSPALALNPPDPDVRPFESVIFVMNDWMNGDWGNPDFSYSYQKCKRKDASGNCLEWETITETGHPEYGALGGWWGFAWNLLNPAKGVYNWSLTDNYIRRAQNMQVTLSDGRIISKPVGISIDTWELLEQPGRYGVNHTPSWVAREPGANIESCYDPDGSGSCLPFCTPNFGNSVWQKAFDDFVIALGQHYDHNPEFANLAFINIATGVDGETAERKNIGGCQYFSENSSAFNAWVNRVMEVYNRAFPHTPQFIQSMLHGIHYHAGLAASFSPRSTGVKVNGLAIDHEGSEIHWDGVLIGGITGFSQLFHDQILTGFEPGVAPGLKGSYWMFIEALSVHPDMLDIQLPFISLAYQAGEQIGFPLLDFIRNHLGKTKRNSDDVWIVLRETKQPDQCWDASDGHYKCYVGHHGDFEYWLYRKENAPRSQTATLLSNDQQEIPQLPLPGRNHLYAWHSTRRTDQASGNVYMSFDVDDGFKTHQARPKAAGGESLIEVTVTFLNQGNDYLALEYQDFSGNLIRKRIQKGPLLGSINDWVDYTFSLDDAYFNNDLAGDVDFRINCENDGNEIVHRLIVKGGVPGEGSSLDLDGDELINESDLKILLDNWRPLGPVPTPPSGQVSPDLNQDRRIDEIDLNLLLVYWQS